MQFYKVRRPHTFAATTATLKSNNITNLPVIHQHIITTIGTDKLVMVYKTDDLSCTKKLSDVGGEKMISYHFLLNNPRTQIY